METALTWLLYGLFGITAIIGAGFVLWLLILLYLFSKWMRDGSH